MTSLPDQRPPLDATLTAAEFARWYWLKEELAGFARELGIRATGGKQLLAARITARLEGRGFVEPPAPRRGATAQLAGPLSAATLIPRGQRCSQHVRAWLTAQLGPGFHFDAEMRGFFAGNDGTRTLQDALDHWQATRGQGPRTIDAQFELNRFTRAWHAAHPEGTRAEVLAAWRQYRNTPIDGRA